MNEHSDWFSRYWELDADERREFLQFASDDPELRDEVDQIRHFERILDRSSDLCRHPLSDDALLFYLQRDSLDTTAPAISHTLSTIEEALAGNSEAMRRYQVMEKRYKNFDAAIPVEYSIPDAVRQSRRITSERRERYSPRVDRPSIAVSLGRHLANSTVICTALYGILFMISLVVSPAERRIAYLASDDPAIELLLGHERGDPQLDESIALILEGAHLQRLSQISTIGLFRRYDPIGLATAGQVLEDAYFGPVPADVEPFAAYFMAKHYLAMGQGYNAQEILYRARSQSYGILNAEIERLLKRLGD